MSKRKNKNKKAILTTIVIILAVVLVVGACVFLFKPSETKTISKAAFSRGSLNALGNPVNSVTSIYTAKMFGCVGLKIEPVEEANVKYQVFY